MQQELDAGLLVVGESGGGTLSRLLSTGTPGTGTVRRAQASVMVVRGQPG